MKTRINNNTALPHHGQAENIMKNLSKSEAIKKFGQEIVNKVMTTNAEPTNRMIYPSFDEPSHIGKVEYAGEPVEADGYKVTACYYLTPEDEENIELFDWEDNAEFDVEEIW